MCRSDVNSAPPNFHSGERPRVQSAPLGANDHSRHACAYKAQVSCASLRTFHIHLCFCFIQCGAGRRDLKRELEEAEWEATNRKRIKAGLEPLPRPTTASSGANGEDKERRGAVARAIELDRDSSSSASSASSAADSESESDADEADEGEAGEPASDSDSDSGSDTEDDSDSEDEQTALLRELEKIKAERTAEKARLASLSSTAAQLSREEEIARGNPLLNLQNALHNPASSSTQQGEEVDFGVRRRWDDDVIFKNQASAAGNTGRGGNGGGFVNDLTRSEFHKKFMNRYIK